MIKSSIIILIMAIGISHAIAQQATGVSLAVNNAPAASTAPTEATSSQTKVVQPTPAQNSTSSEPNPANEQTDAPIPANPHDPNAPTVLENQAPNESELSVANTQLLAKNAKLERQIDTLATQNNVLVQERSGQLFMYGAITLAVGVILGFMLARMIARKDRW